MTKLFLKDFYEVNTEITLASELFYISELGKFISNSKYDEVLSLKGIKLNNILTNSKIWPYFCMAVEQKWVIDVETELDINSSDYIMPELLKELQNVVWIPIDKKVNQNREYINDLRIQEVRYFNIEYQGNDFISIKEDEINNRALNGIKADLSWVSFVAFLSYLRHSINEKNVVNYKVHLKFGSVTMNTYNSLALLLNLYKNTKALSSWLQLEYDYNISMQDIAQQDYFQWYIEGQEKGLLDKKYRSLAQINYSNKKDKESTYIYQNVMLMEKKKRIKELGIQEGDIVVLYERKQGNKKDLRKTISDSHFAVVKKIENKAITLNVIYNDRLKFESYLEYKKYVNSYRRLVGEYNPEARTSIKRFDYNDLGIEYEMLNETMFIVPLEHSDGMIDIYIRGEFDEIKTKKISQINWVFWLLKEYEIDFNESHFIEKFFIDEIPAYELLKERVAIEYGS